ncbi:NlpC/P60 family protein [Salinarimonas soli]|uniref:Peptidase P60 n=1 Tax=Salinarimonas soli TaxID=1638099 RepID=A0A5B2VDT4_9HYPH|nr:NlpC/P60 family protein [Salinarimonas soli]KAA2237251.1 peptidase P60 [Salinarimonas soli]
MTPSAPIVAAARGWIGTPFRHQASLKGVGCDCLGLVRGVWREVVGAEPEAPPAYPPDWAATGRDLLREAIARHCVPAEGIGPGAVLLLAWRDGAPAGHCAIATGPDAIVHAHAGAVVAEVSLRVWRRRVVGVFRFP